MYPILCSLVQSLLLLYKSLPLGSPDNLHTKCRIAQEFIDALLSLWKRDS